VSVDFVVDNWLALLISVALIGYLIVALLFPEKF
jgi:K+-transporting ATPase KdpF subunit